MLDSLTNAWSPATFDGTAASWWKNGTSRGSRLPFRPKVQLTLLASGLAGYQTSIRLDSMHWQRPVSLTFASQGGDFWTQAGAGGYITQRAAIKIPIVRRHRRTGAFNRPSLQQLQSGNRFERTPHGGWRRQRRHNRPSPPAAR